MGFREPGYDYVRGQRPTPLPPPACIGSAAMDRQERTPPAPDACPWFERAGRGWASRSLRPRGGRICQRKLPHPNNAAPDPGTGGDPVTGRRRTDSGRTRGHSQPAIAAGIAAGGGRRVRDHVGKDLPTSQTAGNVTSQRYQSVAFSFVVNAEVSFIAHQPDRTLPRPATRGIGNGTGSPFENPPRRQTRPATTESPPSKTRPSASGRGPEAKGRNRTPGNSRSRLRAFAPP